MANDDFEGKTALVTGATSGIGRAVAIRIAQGGGRVLVGGRDHGRGDEVVAKIAQTGGQAEFMTGEMHDAATARDLANRALDAADGAIDILINNAGIGTFGPTEGFDEPTFDQIFAVNVKAPFYLVGALAPGMAARGRGAIVNVTTMAADFGMAGMAVYGASKAAVSLMTKSWAAEYGPSGVRVNAVSPGPTRTPAVEFMGEALDQMGAQAPLGYVAQPEEIAAAIAYLASDQASFVHGTVVHVDGGRTAI
jgi:NAD(P)-dependent dehydrogenase (short-subunit alcohol dehydrogenase family)